MKLALVFDDLIQFGGAERLLLAAHEIWPDAPVYTSVVSNDWKDICAEKGIDVRTSFMQRFPFIEKLYKHYAPFLFYPIAFESFELSDYDVVLSISSRFSHGVRVMPRRKHICYMNSPGRMFWEPFEYFSEDGFIKKLQALFLAPALSTLRVWDYRAAQKVDHFIANSKTPHSRIKKYYGRDADIIYPFVEFGEDAGAEEGAGEYFLVITRLVSWKRVEHAISACEKAGVSLKVIGTGPDMGRLKGLAGENTQFLGYVSEKEKINAIKGSRAIIITQHEDFGIVPLEAMYHGKPVIAYGAGGVLETVVPGRTGEFYYTQSADHLAEAINDFDPERYSAQECKKQAEIFSKDRFKKSLEDYVNSVYCNLHSHVSINAGTNTTQN